MRGRQIFCMSFMLPLHRARNQTKPKMHLIISTVFVLRLFLTLKAMCIQINVMMTQTPVESNIS